MDSGKKPEEKVESPAGTNQETRLVFLQPALNQIIPPLKLLFNSHPGASPTLCFTVSNPNAKHLPSWVFLKHPFSQERGRGKKCKLRSWILWVQMLSQFFTSCVTLNKLFNLSVPLFPYLLNEYNNSACLIGLLQV